MTKAPWPRRLEDGTVVVALHVEGERRRIRELLELLVAEWLAYEESIGRPLPDSLTKLPTVEPREEGGADVLFESRGDGAAWHRPIMRFSVWMSTHSEGLRVVALDDRVGGESRVPLTISA